MKRIAFVGGRNAGTSQMAAAFAEREAKRRGLDVEVVTGGVEPGVGVDEAAAETMDELGIDVRDRTPRKLSTDELHGVDLLVTMNRPAEAVRPDGWDGESRTWDVPITDELDRETARNQRDVIERRVSKLFDTL
ncbi:arsenate-mycothiol transferase ArsC [Natronorarus salvus]|uniref:arsenate-mycothiol transferase ArsC n=1 Tax=Natronorarus salvus TaxID=3117733 RepID=UPI002F263484